MLALAHIRMRMLSLLRSPAYVAGTLAMPSLILIFLGVALADTAAEANVITASFTVFAVMGIAFFQFGVGIAESRNSPWTTFERILPAPIAVRLAGNAVPAMLFAAAAAGLVILVAHVFMPVSLSAVAWLRLCLVLLAGGIGGLSGTLLLILFGRLKDSALLQVATGLSFGLGLVLFAQTTYLPVSLSVIVVVGAASTAFGTINNTLIQSIVDNEFRGRVMSIHQLGWGSSAIGALLMGSLAETVSAPFALSVSGAAVALGATTLTMLAMRGRAARGV